MIPALRLTLSPHAGGLRALRAGEAGPGVDAMMLGRPVEDVLRLLPAVFGLCRSVQETALALALDRAPPDPEGLRRDMIRDHLARFCLHLPRALGLLPMPLPQGWMRGGAVLRQALFGADGLPAPSGFEQWLLQGQGAAPVVAAVMQTFAPFEAATLLPPLDPIAPFARDAVENALIARHGSHPLLAHVVISHGRGPLAHLVARLVDLDALSRGGMPAARRLADGTALVPCSRGLCALRLRVAGGMVTGFDRRTPTDHLLMPGGLMEASLARLPAAKAGAAPLLAAILDPCVPVMIEGGLHA
ncbi:hydrogenase expression/formation protein HupK [Neotabrizicola sp. VNH66]|uniref:hydrogenase expression/formation protein HupK n=1 Tax=Neotabrizicola sp. VNH66 TaxID=3400918 RepID=UPI003C0AA1F4